MQPRQVTPNEFELAILDRLAVQEPAMRLSLTGLHVLSREFTGVGSFTRFQCEDSSRDDKRQVSLGSLIAMPGVPGGMGAVLFCRGDRPECLETYTYGDERWDGTYDGFSIEEAG